jgi:hypothetical protein
MRSNIAPEPGRGRRRRGRGEGGVGHGATPASRRACSRMWPRWMPSLASARSAARLEASPTAATTIASSCVDADRDQLERGAHAGRLRCRHRPGRAPAAARWRRAEAGRRCAARSPADGSDRRCAAKPWAPASIARQSWPSATAAASTPFITPLLCVTARATSSSAKRLARAMPSAIASPPTASADTSHRARARRPSARLVRMRRSALAADRGDHLGRHRLGDGVDQVGAHRVADVDVDLDDHRALGGVEHPGAHRASSRRRARPSAGSPRRPAGTARRRSPRSPPARGRRRGAVDVDLRGHDRRVGVAGEAAAQPDQRAAADAAATTDGSSTAIGTR